MRLDNTLTKIGTQSRTDESNLRRKEESPQNERVDSRRGHSYSVKLKHAAALESCCKPRAKDAPVRRPQVSLCMVERAKLVLVRREVSSCWVWMRFGPLHRDGS